MYLIRSRSRGRLAFGAALLLAALAAGPMAPGASAQATRTWISGVGDDVNPCSRTAPCKTIAGSISKTAAGGEINALDPGGFGTVTVTKPITIDFSAIGTGGVLNQSVSGVLISAGASDDVILRGLDIFGAAALSPGACLYGGLAGVRVLGGRTIRIEDSTIASQATGVQLVPTGSNLTVLVDRVDVTNACSYGIQAAPAAGHTVDVTVRDSTFFNAGTAIAAGAGARVRLTGTTISGNAVGIDTSGGGVVEAYGAGQVFGNGVDGTPTATIATGTTGPAGPTGPAGLMGATGPAGPKGDLVYRLLVILQKTRLSVARGHGVALDYVSTSAADAKLEVRKGAKVVATVSRKARLGRNTILWSGKLGRRSAPAGRYRLTVRTASADGQRGSASATLTIRSHE